MGFYTSSKKKIGFVLALMFVFLLSFPCNSTAESLEKGDVLFRDLNMCEWQKWVSEIWGWFATSKSLGEIKRYVNEEAGHVGIFTEWNRVKDGKGNVSENDLTVYHMQDGGLAVTTVTGFKNPVPPFGCWGMEKPMYWGAGTSSNLSYVERNELVKLVEGLINQLEYGVIKYKNPPSFRCDGLIEWLYEQIGYNLVDDNINDPTSLSASKQMAVLAPSFGQMQFLFYKDPTVTVYANDGENGSGVALVDFFVDGEYKGYDDHPSPFGDYYKKDVPPPINPCWWKRTIRAVAYDQAGNKTEVSENLFFWKPGCDNPDDNYSVGIGSSLPPNLGKYSNGSEVGSLQVGYSNYTENLLATFKRNFIYVYSQLSPSELLKQTNVLVVSSGSFYGMENSAVFKDTLAEYVKSGGTLLVFAQQHGYQYSALPTPDGKPIEAYGWIEDQSCVYRSSYVSTWHQVLAGLSQSVPSVNVDGYFTSYPAGSISLLKKTANGQPAMIMYSYGNGYVIATTIYTDFAYSMGQASAEEKALFRDIVTWARQPAQLPEIRPGGMVEVPQFRGRHT